MRTIQVDTKGKSLPYETNSYFRKYQYIDSYILLCENKIVGEEVHEFNLNQVSGTLVSTAYLIYKLDEKFLIEKVQRFSDVREVILTSANSSGYKYRVVKADGQSSGKSSDFSEIDYLKGDDSQLDFLYEKYPTIRFSLMGANVRKNISNHQRTIVIAYDTIAKKNVLLLLDSELNILSKTCSSIPDEVLSINKLYIGAVAMNKSLTKWSINQYDENLEIVDSFMIKGTDLILAEFQGTCVLLYNDYTKYSSEQKQLLKETGASIGPCTAIAIFGN